MPVSRSIPTHLDLLQGRSPRLREVRGLHGEAGGIQGGGGGGPGGVRVKNSMKPVPGGRLGDSTGFDP